MLEILNKLSSDQYLEFLKRFYNKGINDFNNNWYYADILTVLHSISKKLDIESYLEIGVRRGGACLLLQAIIHKQN